ncbi:hypothetical protein L2755_11915 [Shewanella abyssi]|uniref:hypothetical protein n=1 Tax=Shewanella abyssi TaxID=311789 RepID=UPI00200FF5ED|nr:hypothetical protein [Shewanella abyssi]MCL1050330.1 hypothetical protein [Shewanella abyssi]
MKELNTHEAQAVTGGIDNLPGVPSVPDGVGVRFGSDLWRWMNGQNGRDGAPKDDRDRSPSQ